MNKLQSFRRLSDGSKAALDLLLLQRLQPQNAQISKYSLNPERYADDILFDLLDVAAEEQILENRSSGSEERGARSENSNKGQKKISPDTHHPSPDTHHPSPTTHHPAPEVKKKSRKKKSTPTSRGMT